MGQALAALNVHPTGHICASCEKELGYTEECFLFHIVRLARNESGQVACHPVIDEDSTTGDFFYDPYYFCFKCGEDLLEKLKEDAQEEEPVDDNENSTFGCACCGSGIREWEMAGTVSLGEFHLSRRAPNGIRGPSFQLNGKPDLLCLFCLTIINNNHIEMWDSLSEAGECEDCILDRCWRDGSDLCACPCHHEEVETNP